MNIELYLLRKLLKREAFMKYRKYIKIKEPRELNTIYTLLDELHNALQRDISLDELTMLVKEKDEEALPMLEQAYALEVQEDSVDMLLQRFIEKQWAYELALHAINVHEGKESVDKLKELCNNVPSLEEEIHEGEWVSDDIDEILAGVDRRTGGLRWRLRSLDQAIGGLRKGDFGFIFARPETGKTTFLASEISGFASQTKEPVIWMNNEEAAFKVKGRMIQGALGWTTDQLVSQKRNVMQEFNKKHSQFHLKDLGFMHKRDVERIMEQYKPALLVFDQIDKVKGFKADRDDLLLGSIYQWARELAKEYCPIIGVCQAAATAENKKWLTSDDIAKSKTEKFAEGDFVIGIGKTHDVGYENIRYLNVIKNKLTGIHARIECIIEPEIARYRDL